jgi:hypothetical protein
MKKNFRVLGLPRFQGAAVLLTVSAAFVFGQGDLTPPGAPAPTMKTLTQVEPRTPIISLPFTASQPGSYYLTANLSSTAGGIRITAADVTIDLNGFTITGPGAGSSGITHATVLRYRLRRS